LSMSKMDTFSFLAACVAFGVILAFVIYILP
jgi:hypothetical protein